ncbi:uncharacterized protein JNUCC1_03725 [Lentibacillus sp. JNUCC-1]|nr:uncharacterized protein [Lentibacillus sp. JNUCC-1]
MEAVKQQRLHISKEQLAALYDQMLTRKDEINAQKMLDLYDKHIQQTISISFAGHFSAGKSSMINTLLDADILPKSPIPTSANIVRLTSGEGVARIYFKHQQPVEYSEPYDIEQIKAYSKDKTDIKQIDISTSQSLIPKNRYIIDTPGIDAADDADRVMTEGALHLVDHIFYVMDYNHVQSEVNLEFLNNIQKQGLPFSLIINQIDKHDEEELSFANFQMNVEKTFFQWGLKPEDIYYTSLVQAKFSHNDLHKVKTKLSEMLSSHYEDIQNTSQSAKQIIESYKHRLEEQAIEQKDILKQKQNSDFNREHLNDINDKISHLERLPDDLVHALTAELNLTLQNAYLMPATTRDLAESFLQSTQSSFKVGLIGSKRKTENERIDRLNAFLNALKENIQTTIEWKLRDKFISLLKQHNVHDENTINRIQSIYINYGENDVLKLVKSGAMVTGQYVLNFTNEVANDIKQQYKQKALHVFTQIKQDIVHENTPELTELKQAKKEMEKNVDLDHEKEMIDEALQDSYDAIDAALNQTLETNAYITQAEAHLAEQVITFKQQTGVTLQQPHNRQTSGEMESGHASQEVSLPEASYNYITKHIEETIQTVADTPGFSTFISDLKRKQARLEERSYTISLFGAFSAGKSTFANAMLGESVLPVSPNPTTAAVNRINPVTPKYPHGTVTIQVKDAATMLSDLRAITKKLSPPESDLSSFLEWVRANDIQHSKSLSQLYQSYLQAVLAGYDSIKHAIGQTMTVTLDDFPDYVADETKASFIESIDLYYDCPLTQEGITLVDTPGADSVNARHTNVAFDYIKQADAILYVTYYNHALSKADKTFLTQLGRVKDAFQLDKMFFIVNAADLAEDEAELKLVTTYVEEQLTQLGIRLPNLYPVSSKQSLREKEQDLQLNGMMHQFEKDFNRFIHYDLTAITAQSAVKDIHRTKAALDNYRQSIHMDQEAKQTFIESLEEAFEQAKQDIAVVNSDAEVKQLTQRIEKQLHYVWERVSLRYHDLFKESFNPTTITSSGREAHKELKQSLSELIDDIAYELLQELRAVSLRVESTIQKLAQEIYDKLGATCEEQHHVFSLPAFETPDLQTPNYESGFKSIDLTNFDHALTVFKNTKSFFVDNQKEIMKEKIYEVLDPMARSYLDMNKNIMEDHYLTEWSRMIQSIQQG